MTRENDLSGKHDEWKFSGLKIVWVGTILDWILWIGVKQVGMFWVLITLGGNCPVGIIRVAIFWVVVFLVPSNEGETPFEFTVDQQH